MNLGSGGLEQFTDLFYGGSQGMGGHLEIRVAGDLGLNFLE